MSQRQLPGATASPRHPSAGNVGSRPALVNNGDPEPAVGESADDLDALDSTAGNVELGPGLRDEAAQRLVGNVEGRRVLELGCGTGANAVRMARQGAKVIVVDSSAERLTAARRLAEAADVRVEFHHGDLADLAFVRGDQIDQALAVYSLAAVDDISRVFRQVHRVLRTEAPFVISLPHPIELICSDETAGAPRLQRSAFDRSPIIGGQFGPTVIPHRMTDVFTELVRSNFRPDALLEPADGDVSSGASAERRRWIPSTVIIRGRKQGI